MKKLIRILVISFILMSIPLFMLAQNPPHPNGGGAPGAGNTPVGGGAPIGGGLIIMLVLGAGYGTRKIYNEWNKEDE